MGSRLVSTDALSRRHFMLGTSIASLSLGACSKPPRDDIVPYVHRPSEVVPGTAQYYATSTTRRGYAFGLLVESHEGRPTKIEGHPKHPASLGATGVREQASILDLYGPDRARSLRERGTPRSFGDFAAAFGPGRESGFAREKGRGLSLVLEPTASPLRASLVDRLRNRYPALSLTYYSPFSPLARWEGSRRAFGRVVESQRRLENADVILSLDSDFLSLDPMSVQLARAFTDRRRVSSPTDSMNRLYVIESAMTITGAVADHRLAIAPSTVGQVAASLLAAVMSLGNADGSSIPEKATRLLEASPDAAWIRKAAEDLVRHRGRVAVFVGDRQPPEVHVIAHALESLLDPGRECSFFSDSALVDAGGRAHDIQPLLDGLDAQAVETLVILGANPSYSLPHDARWDERVSHAKDRIHLTLMENETTTKATWVLPNTHFLEQWGDGRAYDGTLTFVQPLIRPLYDGRSVEEVLTALDGSEATNVRTLLEARYAQHPGIDRGLGIASAVQRGYLTETSLPEVKVALSWDAVHRSVDSLPTISARIELAFSEDARADDSALANNAWLKELPDPIDKTVWGNAALVSEALARALKLDSGDVVEVAAEGATIALPVLVQPGHAETAITIWFGYGRRSGSVGEGVGRDIGPVRTLASPWLARDVSLRKTSRKEPVVVTQEESDQHERPIAVRRTLSDWAKDVRLVSPNDEAPPSILPDRLHGSPQWGMSIDLNACIGCNSCVVACQSENNIPVVGKANVALSREMHWLRIDRYVAKENHETVVDFQPMACQHCEKAPCEYVCPVNATVHSPDGLNEMVYNRCVGTRFCSNNCPYKVRRFNFFDYNQSVPETERMGKNPSVTVRARGVMEKCTYCVQRIRRAEISAHAAGRELADGDVRTACEQACPTRAIVFGPVDDPSSRVSKAHANPRSYSVLGEIGTRPRTRYLARIGNPNPELRR